MAQAYAGSALKYHADQEVEEQLGMTSGGRGGWVGACRAAMAPLTSPCRCPLTRALCAPRPADLPEETRKELAVRRSTNTPSWWQIR